MTLCVAVTTADGLVMGADSTTYVTEPSIKPTTYDHAEKVFQLLSLPVIAMTYGLASIGRRSIASLIAEWNEDNSNAYGRKGYTVEALASDISRWLYGRHKKYVDELEAEWQRRQLSITGDPAAIAADPAAYASQPFNRSLYKTGLVVGGHQPTSFFPHLFAWDSETNALVSVREHEGVQGCEGPRPGADWWGLSTSVNRLVQGIDRELMLDLVDGGYLKVPPANDADAWEHFWAIISKHQFQVAYDGMPLQDAVNLTKYLLKTACGFERFTAGMTRIGGEIDIVVVGRTGIHWSNLKQLSAAMWRRPS
jgi:hypothetical protein